MARNYKIKHLRCHSSSALLHGYPKRHCERLKTLLYESNFLVSYQRKLVSNFCYIVK
ncbi:hypothetical protein [Rickettsia endosymbiont of Ceutorhynchus obstrictus]|uniref:hypothetical protein n=1 Tax=Rickettsia endosymbiont of Ceutorhynchus obstrictus TaxID=3066249 RepID=UPI003132B4B1